VLNKHEYRYDVQALRGVAVLAVLLFHASDRLFPIGYLGVDVFFVISGFVVTPLILRIFDASSGAEKITNLKKFYVNRFYRLAPALVMTLFLSTFLIFFLGPISDHQRVVRQGIATIFLIGNVGAYKYSGDYFQPNANPLVHTWSLSVEEQIYILLPLCFLSLVRSARNLKTISLRILISISVLSFLFFIFPRLLTPIYSLVRFESFLDFSFYSPINRIWQFSLGGII
jgi:peptidoglycan/LPS O-acetylase OafA/YrhL